MSYTQLNSEIIDTWAASGWQWGIPITSEQFQKAKQGDWSVVLTPMKPVPKSWFCDLAGAAVLGLASGGGQQIPIFSALGAHCTVLDYSEKQLESERKVAEREGYEVTTLKADMTQPWALPDESFDLIFHPVSNCYIETVLPVWRECFRVLKKGGILLAGLDNGINYIFDDDEKEVVRGLPFNPLQDKALYDESIAKDWGIQFSHTIEEQIGGQLAAGLTITDIFQDTNGVGNLHTLQVPTFYATRAIKLG